MAESATEPSSANAVLNLDHIDAVDALTGLQKLPGDSVDCVVTSPPYWRARDYGIPPVTWPDGSQGQLGLESDPNQYIDHLLSVFDEVRRILKPSGTLWINIGDVYAHVSPFNRARRVEGVAELGVHAPAPGRKMPEIPGKLPGAGLPGYPGVAHKSLCLMPLRLTLGMVARGWILRNDIVWYKPNHLPSSVRDRFTNTWEHVLFFTKSPRYYFNLDAVRVPHATRPPESKRGIVPPARRLRLPEAGFPGGGRLPPRGWEQGAYAPGGKNPGDHWAIRPETRSWMAILGRNRGLSSGPSDTSHPYESPDTSLPAIPQRHLALYPEALCARPILAGCPRNGVVLDPFMGSGTTAVAAQRLGRHFLGFELNAAYVALAHERLAQVPLAVDQAGQSPQPGEEDWPSSSTAGLGTRGAA